ncbi:chorismate-binding protein [Arthrobacter sp. zg-ZUI100]|uniref:chorismate-binding protein n=1 Tax=Arthrobacter jiangjiafuii TaxID=2817475 RepID=UPI001AEEDB48|nr:chorismate-binding protein [Arthrobacter jiangjiafuii]MBP3035320.1 chorismate-binding protein [Arthrobacter jiangjiafuii]
MNLPSAAAAAARTAAATSALPVLIAVDGFSGAGKTTLAIELAAALRAHHRVSLFHLEDIYPGWDGLAAGIAYYRSHIAEPLAAGRRATWQAWDWEAGHRGEARSTEPAEIVILEGVGASHAGVRHLLDVAVWVQAPEQLRREQALERDGETYAPHWERWAAQERAWAQADPAASRADLTVNRQHRYGTPGAAAGYVLRALADLQLPRLQPLWQGAGPGTHTVKVERIDAWADPAELFAALYADAPRAVWLDSSSAAAPAAAAATAAPAAFPASSAGAAHIAERSRFSIMADDGGARGRYAEHRSGMTTVVSGPVTASRPGPFFSWLDGEWGASRALVPGDYPCGFALGWLGFLGYELRRETGGSDIGPVPGAAPDAALIFAGRAVVLDHHRRCLYALTLAEADGGWVASVAAAARVLSAAQTADTDAGPGQEPGHALPVPQFTVRDDRESYLAKVRAAQREIADGNSYEVCLTTSLTARLPAPLDRPGVLALYRALRRRSPAPFASLLRFDGYSLAGTSPERFLALDAAGRMRAEPIKGTRPRGAGPVKDRALEAELTSSVKDRAENVMIVDLLRNDLSRSAVPGSVTVPRLCVVESYATVHQLVSTVDAQLAPSASRAEAIAAAFPPGSMTGAPKISTMAILETLEGAARGPYSGVAGWFSLTGAADLSVVIRTLEIRDGELVLGVGGAVTAGSDPGQEWEEVRAKACGVLSALGATFPQE